MSEWEDIAKDKRAEIRNLIPDEWRLSEDQLQRAWSNKDRNVLRVAQECRILTDKELEITEQYDVLGLLEQMKSGNLTAREVTTAFCKRAAIAQQLTCCLTEIFFAEALETADALDDYFNQNKELRGPLHGIPVSLKDPLCVAGQWTTLGYTALCKYGPDEEDSFIAKILKRAGAVLYVKTNIPQTQMCAESQNNLFGRTLNPHKLNLTAGGSSGGEGSLLGFRGSILGIGTDVAGSIRIPAYCNGVYGFRPSIGRISNAGQGSHVERDGMVGIEHTTGPLAQSVSGLKLLLKSVLDCTEWNDDPFSRGMRWRDVNHSNKKLRLGLIPEHERYPLHPTVMRALHEAKTILRENGHEVIPIERTPSLEYVARTAWKFFALDPQQTELQILKDSGEPIIDALSYDRFPDLDDYKPTLDGLYDLNIEKQKITDRFNKIFEDYSLDAFLMPVYHSVAAPRDRYGIPVYTVFANMIDVPAASIPFLKAEKYKDEPFVRYNVKYIPEYDPDGIEGAPCGVQVVGQRYRDEELMEYMDIIDRALNFPTSLNK